MKYHISFDLDLLENPYPGRYIALEGIDGSGKSTQLHLVAQALRDKNLPVTLTSEPLQDSAIGKIIREVLAGKVKIPSAAFQYLYSADRVDNQEKIVKPNLAQGNIVLSHRSFWSVIPYGLTDKNLTFRDAQVLMVAQGLLSQYHQFLCPDMTFFLDVPVETALSRLSTMRKQKDLYEKKDKLTKIAKGYTWQLHKFPKMFVKIDGTQSEEKITEEIVAKVLRSM